MLTALAVGAPSVSSAATLTAASSTTAPSLAVKVLALGGGAVLGAAGGAAGVLFGTRQLKRQARSVDETLTLKQFEIVSVSLVMATSVPFPLSWRLTHQPWTRSRPSRVSTSAWLGL